jgi:hypothetical protein
MAARNRPAEQDPDGGAAPGFGCARCVTDPAVAAAITRMASARTCSFCGLTAGAPVAAAVEEIATLIKDGLFCRYGPAEASDFTEPWGALVGAPTWSTRELLEHVGWPFANPDLATAVIAAVGDDSSAPEAEGWEVSSEDMEWVDSFYPLTSAAESLSGDWERFVQTVTTERRFIFRAAAQKPELHEYEPDRFEGAALLGAVADLIVKHDLIRKLPAGTQLHRVRVHDPRDPVDRAAHLGSPPARAARANRMSAAGIPMFYGALDSDTAVAETVDPADAAERLVTVGRFELTAPLIVVDFMRLPARPPGLFDPDRRAERGTHGFLLAFVQRLSLPVRRDGGEHIDYVPTQMLSEFLLHELVTPQGVRPAGLLHRSAARPEGVVAALRVDASRCVDEPDPSTRQTQLWLREVSRAQVDVTVTARSIHPLARAGEAD